MNFDQNKLTKSEWESIEISVPQDKLEILRVIIDGFYNVNITYNKTVSLLQFLKIEMSSEMEDYLFNTYFSKRIVEISKKYGKHPAFELKIKTNAKIKTADAIRIKNSSDIADKKIYEFLILDFIEELFKHYQINNNRWIYYYFTISKISRNNISQVNKNINTIINSILKHFEDKINIHHLIYHSVDFIEKNENLMKYSDITLYDHQKKNIHRN